MIAGERPRFLWGRSEEAAPDRRLVLQYLGYREGRTRLTPQVEALLDEGISRALGLLRPRATLVECRVAGVGGREVRLAVGRAWRSSYLARRLRRAQVVTAVAATVGGGVEREVADLFRLGEYALAVVVDAAGTAAVHAWLASIRRQVAERAGALGLQVGEPVGPGYGDWDLGAQAELLAWTEAGRIGLTANGAGYLLPQKSLVAVLGWEPAGEGRPLPGGCATCALVSCAFRQHVEPA